jgi:hypothetical protein
MHPLQGASFLSTPLQGGILKPPALRVVADFTNSVESCTLLVIVEREIPYAAHALHVGDDTHCPHTFASRACTTSAQTALSRPGTARHHDYQDLEHHSAPQVGGHDEIVRSSILPT